MNRLFAVANVLGKMVLVFGFTMLVPLCLSLWINDGASTVFVESILITIGGGLFLWLVTRRFKRELQIRDGFLLVVLVWSVFLLSPCFPCYYSFPN